MGTFLALLNEHKSTNELERVNNVSRMAGASNTVPVYHVDSSDMNLPTELLKEYSVNDKAYKNFLLIVGNVWTGVKVLSLWTMGEIFLLLIDELGLSEEAKALHRLKCDCELDESMSVLGFIEIVLLPLSYDEEHEVEAVKLLLVVKDVLTNTGNAWIKKDLQSTRKGTINHKFSLTQSEDLDGNVVAGGEDHLGSSSNSCDGHKRDAVNICFSLLMHKHIERKLPAQLLAPRGGFGLGSLRLSFTDMTRRCNKFTPEFMFGSRDEDKQTAAALHRVYDTDDKVLRGLKACILKEKCNKNDTSFAGEKKIVLYTDSPAQKKAFESLGEFAFGEGDL
jgi:hypothetical protein